MQTATPTPAFDAYEKSIHIIDTIKSYEIISVHKISVLSNYISDIGY